MALPDSLQKALLKANTREEKMKICEKHGWGMERLEREVAEKRDELNYHGTLFPVDYSDPQLFASALGLIAYVGGTDITQLIEDQKPSDKEGIAFHLSMAAARKEELRASPVYRFNQLLIDYQTLCMMERMEHRR